MARPIRLDYPNSFYHVLSRGNELKDIFLGKAARISSTDVMLPAAELRGIWVFNYDYFRYMPLDPTLKCGVCAARLPSTKQIGPIKSITFIFK